MATPRCTLFEVATNLACAGGVAEGAIPDVLADDEVRSVVGEESLTIDLPRRSAAWAVLRERKILRTVFSDQSFDEWRITNLLETRGPDGGLRSQVKAQWPVIDLGTVLVARTEANGLVRLVFDAPELTIAEHLSQYLLPSLTEAGLTWWASGQIDSSATCPMTYDGTSVLLACRQLAEHAKLEFRARRNGTTSYLLDFLTQIGGPTDPAYTPTGAPRLFLAYGKNLLGIRRQRTSDGQHTRIYPLGTAEDGIPATIAEAVWKVASAPTTTTLRLVDPNGGDGPLAFDDQLNGLWVRQWPTGSWIQVTDSALLNQEVTTSGAHGVSPNDLVQFALSSAGKELTYLESPADKALYGLLGAPFRRPDIPGTVNLIANPAMRAYATGSNAPPDGWAIIPGSGLAAANVDKETTSGRFRVGGASAKIVSATDGQGLETAYAAISPLDSRPYGSGFGSYWNDTDGARIRMQLVYGLATVGISSMSRATSGGGITTVTVNTSSAHGRTEGDLVEILGATGGTTADGYNGLRRVSHVVDSDTLEYQLTGDPGSISLSSATLRPVTVFTTPGSPASKRWIELGYENTNAKQLAAVVVKVQLMQDGATGATWYVDAAQVTQSAAQLPFVDGSGPTQLWQHANRALVFGAAPGVEYDVDVADLARLDSVLFPYTDILVGGPTTVDDPDLGSISTRVLERRRKLLLDAISTVVLSNRLPDIADLIARPTVRPRQPKAPGFPARILPYRVNVGGQDFTGLTSTDRGVLRYFNGGTTAGVLVREDESAEANAPLPLRGGIIRAFRVTGQNEGNVTDGVVVKLYRDSTLLSTITFTGLSAAVTLSDTTLNEAIAEGANYWVYVRLVGATTPSIGFAVLNWAGVDVEVPAA